MFDFWSQYVAFLDYFRGFWSAEFTSMMSYVYRAHAVSAAKKTTLCLFPSLTKRLTCKATEAFCVVWVWPAVEVRNFLFGLFVAAVFNFVSTVALFVTWFIEIDCWMFLTWSTVTVPAYHSLSQNQPNSWALPLS